MSNNMWQDVIYFHEKFGIKRPEQPQLLDNKTLIFRINFLIEELNEFKAATENNDLPEAFDALIDLVYVAMGTAYMMGCPWLLGWDEVQRANMTKERASSSSQSKRGNSLDVIKPDGWKAPDHAKHLKASGWQQEELPL